MAAYKCIQVIKYSSLITIREFVNREEGSDRYFRAVICGWRNFKFISSNLSSTDLLKEVVKQSNKIKDQLKAHPNSIEGMPSLYIINKTT